MLPLATVTIKHYYKILFCEAFKKNFENKHFEKNRLD